MPSHSVSIHETEDYHRKLKTRRELCNQLKTIIEWLKINYKDYCSKNGVVPITQAQIDDPSFFQHNNREDLNYERLNVGLIKAFLSARKVKGNGKKCSFSHFWKFHDAILFGAEQASQVLPQNYHLEMEKFLTSFKKENVQAKHSGETDDQDADQIPFPLYRLITQWALAAGNVFVWAFTVMQWNCMARSASIDPCGIPTLVARFQKCLS